MKIKTVLLQKINCFINKLSIIIICINLTSCSTNKTSLSKLELDKSYCNKQPVEKYTLNDIAKPLHELQLDTILTNRFSFQSLNIANAIGIIESLTKYTKLTNETKLASNVENRLALLELSQKLNQKISLASLEVSAIASELDCEEERATQFAYYLKEKESKTEKRLIIGSIIIGAASSISSQIISDNSSNTNKED
jgi:hypothetical protein